MSATQPRPTMMIPIWIALSVGPKVIADYPPTYTPAARRPHFV